MKKSAIVFGASGDTGVSITRSLLEKGFDLVLTYNNERLETLKKKLNKFSNQKIYFKKCNFKNENSVEKLIKFSIKKIGEPQIIINTVGVFYYEKIERFSYKKIIDTFKINTFAIITINKAVYKIKKNKKFTKIISLGSSSALNGFKDTFSYCGSKHALLGIIKSLNQTIGKKKIINYCLNVGSIKNTLGKKIRDKNYKNFINQSSIINTIDYLCSIDMPAFPEEIYLKRFMY